MLFKKIVNPIVYSLVVFSVVPLTARAQKLPEIQQASIWLEDFRPDGRLDEWQQPLAAYNPGTFISYSLANDDTYLYLAVLSTRTAKIFTGGIALVVKRSGKPDLEVIYPYNFTYDRSKDPTIGLTHPDRPLGFHHFDKIETRGLTGGADSIISTTNRYGILAGVSDTMAVTEIYPEGERHIIVEMAIPLEHLKLSANHAIDYGIRLRGIKLSIPPDPLDRQVIPPGITRERVRKYEQIKSQQQFIPTELTGTYYLERKP